LAHVPERHALSDGGNPQRGCIGQAAEDVLFLAVGVDHVRAVEADQPAQAQQDLEPVQAGFVQDVHGNPGLPQPLCGLALVQEYDPGPRILASVQVPNQGPQLDFGARPTVT
jgi:hypothetical protein